MKKQTCIRVYADLQQINHCRQKVYTAKPSVKLLANAMSLAGSEVRLNILYILWDQQKLCVCDLSDILDLGISPISQHLKKMKDSGLVDNDKVGQTIFYSLTPEYEQLFTPFFKMIAQNKVFEPVAA